MITITFLAFLGLAILIALTDWRRGWYLAILVGTLQDPVRKATPGTPVILIMCVVAVYIACVAGAPRTFFTVIPEVRHRYPKLIAALKILLVCLAIAAANGLITFGIAQWKVPALALFLYLIPIPAVLLGFRFMGREADLLKFFAFYCVMASIALIGVPLEHLRFDSPLLGTVGTTRDWIRHLPGIQIRILSGFYRAPDIMAWHAAMLSIVSLTLVMKRGFPRGWLWMATASWGLYCAMLSGRRKMIYMIAVFAIVFLIMGLRKLQPVHLASLFLVVGTGYFVLANVASGEHTSVYARGAETSQDEIFRRIEGGTLTTFRQAGIMGLGLGAATQGVQRFAETGISWQEGGAGKLAVELGLPGFVAALLLAFVLFRTVIRIVRSPSAPRGGNVLPAAILAILVANGSSFLASHQPFTDGTLVLMNAFLLGCLLAVPKLHEKRDTSSEPIEFTETTSVAARAL